MAKSFDTIIFDLDGTLADTIFDVRDAINQSLDRMGFPPISMEQARKTVGPGRNEFIRAIFKDIKNPDVDKFIAAFREIYWDHCLDQTRLFTEMGNVLANLDDLKLLVATNKPKVFSEKILTGLGIANRFEQVICPEDVTHAKPHPEMIVKGLEMVGGKPSRTLMVGDTANDLKAGRGAGVALCGVRYGYGITEDLVNMNPDFLIDLPSELLEIVEINHNHIPSPS